MDESLERRITRLEREVRRWRRLGALLALGVAALLVMGQTVSPRHLTADSVTASVFRVVDAEGNLRATLGEGAHEARGLRGVLLSFLDDHGAQRLTLGQFEHGSLLLVADAMDNAEIWLSSGWAGSGPRLDLGQQASLSLTPQGDPSLHLCDTGGNMRLSLSCEDGVGRLTVQDAEGNMREFNTHGVN